MSTTSVTDSSLTCFHPTLQRWFTNTFAEPTAAQKLAWPSIASGKNTLLLAPTGSGKTLAAFLVAINRIMFEGVADSTSPPDAVADPLSSRGKVASGQSRGKEGTAGVRTLYISPLKALGVDVERNLRSPLAGVRLTAMQEEVPHREPTIGVRSGDTPAAERTRIQREPPDILITTPESLFLMLTSRARRILATVETVIIDEIHSMVATKRGAHLFLSLERLERLRQACHPDTTSIQRIGLSATQRPLDEVARLLGGAECDTQANSAVPRPVEIIEAGRKRALEIKIEVPVEDMASLATGGNPAGASTAGPSIPSIWPAIHPRLVELIQQHRSTMIFVNSRRLAERLAAAINELADAELAMAHHGSIAKDMRLQIEGPSKARAVASDRSDVISRAGNRYGSSRSGDSNRNATDDRVRDPTNWSRWPPGGCNLGRSDIPQVSR